MIDVREAKERLKKQLDASLAVESVGSLIKCADLALLLASHDALEEALAKANRPYWFYADDEGTPFGSVYEAAEGVAESGLFGENNCGERHLVEVQTGRPCAPVWAVIRFFTKDELKDRRDFEWFEVTECATEAEAEALLKEAAQ
jgi:hypothetical protein